MMDKLCQYCSGLVSLQPSPEASDVDHSREIDHQPNVEALLQSAKDCRLCKVIQEFWTLYALQERFPDIKEENFGSLELSFDLDEPRSFGSGVSWGLLTGKIYAPWHAFVMTFKLTITTCLLNSKSPSCFCGGALFTDNFDRQGHQPKLAMERQRFLYGGEVRYYQIMVCRVRILPPRMYTTDRKSVV